TDDVDVARHAVVDQSKKATQRFAQVTGTTVRSFCANPAGNLRFGNARMSGDAPKVNVHVAQRIAINSERRARRRKDAQHIRLENVLGRRYFPEAGRRAYGSIRAFERKNLVFNQATSSVHLLFIGKLS